MVVQCCFVLNLYRRYKRRFHWVTTHQHFFFLKADSYILLVCPHKKALRIFLKSLRSICSYVKCKCKFMFAERRLSNSIPKGWNSHCKHTSYQLCLLQARVKNVKAEDLKIKFSPLTKNHKKWTLLSERYFTIKPSEDFNWKQNTFRLSPHLN